MPCSEIIIIEEAQFFPDLYKFSTISADKFNKSLVFVGLDGGIDGLIHVTDITKRENQEEELRKNKKGDQVKTIILSVDAERERVSLGIKQLDSD